MNTTTIGVDVAKSVFQVSLANRAGRVLSRKRLSRSSFQRFLAEQPEADIILEACATAHHWARTAQGYGHHPKLLHAQYVRPYVRRNKTDAADADALLQAARDPELRSVPVKSVDQQALQGLHRILLTMDRHPAPANLSRPWAARRVRCAPAGGYRQAS